MFFLSKYKLFLDCAYKTLNIIILEMKTNAVVDELSIGVEQNLTELAVYYLETMLTKNKLKKSSIKQFYVTIGPGSFTGQRIATIIAKSWCLLYPSCELYALNSLRFQIPYEHGISKISCGNDQNYCGLYSQTTSEIKLISKADFVKLCKANNELPMYENFENIESYNKLLLSNIDHFERIEDPLTLQPIYLKDPVN